MNSAATYLLLLLFPLPVFAVESKCNPGTSLSYTAPSQLNRSEDNTVGIRFYARNDGNKVLGGFYPTNAAGFAHQDGYVITNFNADGTSTTYRGTPNSKLFIPTQFRLLVKLSLRRPNSTELIRLGDASIPFKFQGDAVSLNQEIRIPVQRFKYAKLDQGYYEIALHRLMIVSEEFGSLSSVNWASTQKCDPKFTSIYVK